MFPLGANAHAAPKREYHQKYRAIKREGDLS
jgi:hypothetical protein